MKAYPLSWPRDWPRKPPHLLTRGERRYKYGLTAREAQDGLITELTRLGATDVLISSNLKIRLDGLMRSGQPAPDDAGVAVYFNWDGKHMAMAMDDFCEVQSNTRRLALAVKALRDLERNGGGTMIERAFTGFMALPAPLTTSSKWYEVLNLSEGSSLEDVSRRYRSMAKKLHSDVAGGGDAMTRLNVARDEALRVLS